MFNIFLATGAIGCFVYGAATYDDQKMFIGGGFAVLWLVSVIVFFLKGASMRCPLCLNPVWVGRKCQKHSKVKPALGMSYRLGIATAVIFKGYYRCPYCGEPFNAREIRQPGNTIHRR